MSGQVGDLEPELVADGCLGRGLGVVDDVAQVGEAGDQSADVVLGELAGRFRVVSASGAGESGISVGEEGLSVLAGRPEHSRT